MLTLVKRSRAIIGETVLTQNFPSAVTALLVLLELSVKLKPTNVQAVLVKMEPHVLTNWIAIPVNALKVTKGITVKLMLMNVPMIRVKMELNVPMIY